MSFAWQSIDRIRAARLDYDQRELCDELDQAVKDNRHPYPSLRRGEFRLAMLVSPEAQQHLKPAISQNFGS
jgi:hypothetical protein